MQEIKYININEIKPDTNNPRLIKDDQFKKLCKSIKENREYFETRPILCDKNMVIFAGNMRYKAAKELGLKEVPVSIFDISEEKRNELMIRDNVSNGEWDFDILANQFEVKELEEFGLELKDLKMSCFEGEQKDAEPQIDKADELNEHWKVKTGDLWQIGEHRLLRGDSTKEADVGAVMGQERARLCFTSPPYADQRDYKSGSFDWGNLMNGVTDRIFSIIGDPSDIIVNLGLSYKDGKANFYWNDWLLHCEKQGHPLYGFYVWDKGYGFPGEWNGRLAPSHEFLFHFSVGRVSANKWVETSTKGTDHGSRRFRQKDGSLNRATSPDKIGQPYKIPDSTIRVSSQRGSIGAGDHPAVFSVDFAEFIIKTWGNELDICYEPFCGSGTTMISCQNLNRKCRAIEISPAYCAVILQRMIDAFPDIKINKLN
jgi:DNA modification methylase